MLYTGFALGGLYTGSLASSHSLPTTPPNHRTCAPPSTSGAFFTLILLPWRSSRRLVPHGGLLSENHEPAVAISLSHFMHVPAAPKVGAIPGQLPLGAPTKSNPPSLFPYDARTGGGRGHELGVGSRHVLLTSRTRVRTLRVKHGERSRR